MLQAQIELDWMGEALCFLREKALWLPRYKSLLLADLHIGKLEHFRKNGIAVPLHRSEFLLMDQLIARWDPVHMYYLGDLFHSEQNTADEYFRMWRKQHNAIEMTLVQGNHDIFHADAYKDLGLTLRADVQLGKLTLVHELNQNPDSPTVSGHIHPGVQLRGEGRQSLKSPCFYLNRKSLLMPAFGSTTGLQIIRPEMGSKVIIATPQGLLSYSS
jgi:uncharacterized protein